MFDQSFWVVLAVCVVSGVAFSRMRSHSRDVEPLIAHSIFMILAAAIIPPSMQIYTLASKRFAEDGKPLAWAGSIGLGFVSLGFGIILGLFGLAMLVLAYLAFAWTCIGLYQVGKCVWPASATNSPPPLAAPPAEAGTGQETEKSV